MGSKRITLSSLQPMIKGLGLRGDLAEFFRILVALEHPETAAAPISSVKLQRKLKNLRGRLRGKSHCIVRDPYDFELFPLIYAACGDGKKGVDTNAIQMRTGLPDQQIESTLAGLVEMKILSRHGDQYFPTESHYFFEGMRQSQGFQKFFQFLLMKAAKEAEQDFASDHKLFFASSFSVTTERRPELKQRLKQILLDFADEAEAPAGDKVATLVCGFV